MLHIDVQAALNVSCKTTQLRLSTTALKVCKLQAWASVLQCSPGSCFHHSGDGSGAKTAQEGGCACALDRHHAVRHAGKQPWQGYIDTTRTPTADCEGWLLGADPAMTQR